jgi:hypothetical protein
MVLLDLITILEWANVFNATFALLSSSGLNLALELLLTCRDKLQVNLPFCFSSTL